jgi:hypothetical protein
MRKIFIADTACTDEALMEVADQNPLAALLWPWLLLSLDDWGRGSANPRQLRARLFPENPAVSVELLSEALELYAAAGLVIRYKGGGRELVAVPAEQWFRYQTHIRAEKRTKDGSRYPAPPEETARDCASDEEDARALAQSERAARECAQSADAARDCAQSRADARSSRGCCASPSPSLSPSPSPSPSRAEEHMCASGDEIEEGDRFESEFWPIWPQKKGAKRLAGQRFRALSPREQERCLTAARHFAAAFEEGLVAATYQPRAENFVGGSKSYYQEWAEGVPAYCTPPPSHAALTRTSGGLEASLATLQTVYDSFAEED